MELGEVISLKVQLERDVFEQVVQLCQKFNDQTGLEITNVSLGTRDITALGDRRPTCLFTHCNITVDI